MADTKISALPASTTPLAGTEVLPIVQSSTTKQVSIANLTAGRDVAAQSMSVLQSVATGVDLYTLENTNSTAVTTKYAGVRFRGRDTVNSGKDAAYVRVYPSDSNYVSTYLSFWVRKSDAVSQVATIDGSGNAVIGGSISVSATGGVITTSANQKYIPDDGVVGGAIYTSGGFRIFVGGATESVRADSSGDVTLKIGNLVQGTAAKGVNFTANTPAAGMTSQLLNWYEEGTWTPNQGAGLTVVGAFSSSGTYTRVGRTVTITGSVSGATSVAAAAQGQISTNLPFSAGVAAAGTAVNGTVTASAGIFINGAIVYAADAIAATSTIYFSATYVV